MDNDETAAAAAAATAAMPLPPPQFTLFGKLPVELRRMIWRCALGDDAPLHIHAGIQWNMKWVDHCCWALEGGALCGHGDNCRDEARGRAGEAPHRRKSLGYTTDGFFFAPEKPGAATAGWVPATQLGPEHGGDEGGFHYRVGAACYEARQAFLERFPQTMTMYKDHHADIPGRYSPYRLVRFNGALDVLVARHWNLLPLMQRLGTPAPRPPPLPTFASFRAALTSFRHLAFVATEQMTFHHTDFFAARFLYGFAESVERLSIGVVPHWHRLPDGAVHVGDVNALAADSIHIAHAQRAARLLADVRVRHGLKSWPRTPPWPPVDTDPGPDLWMLRPRPTPPTIGCYLAP